MFLILNHICPNSTLNGNFVKEGGHIPRCGFPKPWVGKDGRVYPGYRMFFNQKLTLKEKSTMVIKEIREEVNWVNYIDAEATKTMMKTSRDMFTVANEEPSNTSKFIMPIVGPINNWTCSIVIISHFQCTAPNMWLINRCADPIMRLNHQLEKDVGCKVLQFITQWRSQSS